MLKIGKHKIRSLVDTGAECSLLQKRVLDSMKNPPKLQNKKVNLQAVDGGLLDVLGLVELDITIGGSIFKHNFYVVSTMNRNAILGRDFLTTHGVRLYYDLGYLRIGKVYVPLEEDVHICSLVRLTRRTKLRPQSVTIANGKTKLPTKQGTNDLLEISGVDQGYILSEPGIMMGSSVTRGSNTNRIPLYLCNNTNRTITLKKGCVIGRASVITNNEIASVQTEQNEKVTMDLGELVVNPEFHDDVSRLLKNNEDLFASSDCDLGRADVTTMKIDTNGHPPIKLRPYRVPLRLRSEVDKNINEMLKAKVIQRSKSPWSFPLVVVSKKDGTSRMCVDFRRLNKITRPMSTPLPLIDDIIGGLDKAKYFTTLDLKSGYWQVAMDPADKEKTAFACHKGLFEFNVMPFGLCNAPGTFQQLMTTVLEGFEPFSVAYLDDIIIWSSSAEEHFEHIQKVLDRIRKYGLKLKLKKCSFFATETSYLGFIINEHGVKPDPDKVAAIRTLPPPTTVKQVRSFIGMSSYYRRFIPNFSGIAEPLIALTRKYARFHWNDKCQAAFDFIKESLTVVPLLAYPDPEKRYTLYCDASDECIGACLTQPCEDDQTPIPNVVNEKPIYYLSHKLSGTQRRWSTIEKEAFAIKWALDKLDHYLRNAEFVIMTDHKPLKYILETPIQNKKIQLWVLDIMGYNCRIEYVEGSKNCCADLLSRVPQTVQDDSTPREENSTSRK